MAVSFSSFVDCAERTYLRPEHQYPWDDIVRGTLGFNQRGKEVSIIAVGSNTFRGFHRLDKSAEGPKETFLKYFVSEKQRLLAELGKIKKPEALHQLSNRIREALVQKLGNIQPEQLRSFNKVRKPVDLYLEHLVSMAKELEPLRPTLVPLLFVPLDSWILNHQLVFSEAELIGMGLSRGLSYGDITEESNYLALQRMAQAKARILTAKLKTPFHPIYYDLFWNNRFMNP